VSPLVDAAVLLAVEAAPAGDPTWQPFVNLGAIGVLAGMLLIFAKGAYQREVKRADTAEAALAALQTKVIELYVPAVVEATRVVGEFLTEARRDRR
jgi:hypothetical protein